MPGTDGALPLEVGSRSACGARAENQDDLRHAVHCEAAYGVLADGAGGHDGGAIASDLVVRLIASNLQRCGAVSVPQLTQCVEQAHQALRERQHIGASGAQRMHTTVVVLTIDRYSGTALWSHVGDSRLVVLRRGRVCQVTRDDSVVRQLVEAGYLSETEAAVHPNRHQLLSALGVDEPVVPHTLANPWQLEDGDVFLLCSDGWWEQLSIASIESTLKFATSAQDWLLRMEQHIVAAARADQDNYSAIAFWAGDPREITRLEA